MKTYTPEDVEREALGEMAQDIRRSLEEDAEEHGPCPVWMLPLFRAGHWLGVKVKEEGASDAEEESITFALGQRVRMSGMQNAYREAVDALERWRAGRPDRGGEELARHLVDEALEGRR